jgi:hypothetical protein
LLRLRVSSRFTATFAVAFLLPNPFLHSQDNLRLAAGPLAATIKVDHGHLIDTSVHDGLSGRTISLGDAFSLVMQDGRIIRASQMHLEQAPALLPLAADTSASRAAARIAGNQTCADLDDAQSGASVHWCLIARGHAPYLRQEITIHAGAKAIPIKEIQLIDFHDPSARVIGTVAGSPIVSGNFYFGFEHPLSYSTVNAGQAVAGLKRTLPLPAGQSITYSSVVGVVHPGQLRRDFLAYVELERAHPYRTFLHYNTWYDLGEGNRFGADDVLNRMHAFGEQLVRKRNVTMDSFLMDDGWDDTSSLWQFDKGFPDGFTPLRATAKEYGFGIGVWLSPWGGYEHEKQERIAYGRSHGYEIIDNGYALSGPRYYEKFQEACLHFVKHYGVNQFKIDGTGNANQVFPGSIFDSDFSAAIHLIEQLRHQDNQIFINLTTGTKPSPFWLRYADSIWRSGEDHDFDGEGSWRQRWITYRDEQTYRNIVQRGPLFPLNSLMLHGIIYARKAEHLSDDPNHDFTDEVHSYFGTGTQLQEMYITPDLLSSADWDTLAESARWSRSHAETLRDTHWIGGDPGKDEAYGWAAWSPVSGIITLRNPSSKPQSISIDVQQAFELPPGAALTYRAHSPWIADKHQPALSLHAGQPHTFKLSPFEVMTLEADPLP